MSQYKVLPSYTDLTSLPDIHNLPVIFSAGVGGVGPVDDTGFQVRNIFLHLLEEIKVIHKYILHFCSLIAYSANVCVVYTI